MRVWVINQSYIDNMHCIINTASCYRHLHNVFSNKLQNVINLWIAFELIKYHQLSLLCIQNNLKGFCFLIQRERVTKTYVVLLERAQICSTVLLLLVLIVNSTNCYKLLVEMLFFTTRTAFNFFSEFIVIFGFTEKFVSIKKYFHNLPWFCSFYKSNHVHVKNGHKFKTCWIWQGCFSQLSLFRYTRLLKLLLTYLKRLQKN